MSRVVSRRAPARRLIVSVTDGQGRPIRAAGLGAWLARFAPARARGTVAIALVTDREMHRLNRQFHGVDRPTDVLSFPAEKRSREYFPGPKNIFGFFFLGDIAIATGVARQQAREYGHSLQTELCILSLHGLLHLLGYDHEVDDGQMRRAEDRLRRKAGLPEGLIGRRPVSKRS